MSATPRSYLAAGLALLMAAPGPAFAGQVVAVSVPAGPAALSVGTAGLGRTQAAAGLLSNSVPLSLSASLRGASALSAPAVRLAAAPQVLGQTSVWAPAAPISAVPPASPLSAAAVLGKTEAPASAAPVASLREVAAVLAESASPRVVPADPGTAKQTWDAFWSRSRFAPAPADGFLTPGDSSAPVPLAAPQPAAARPAAVPGPAAAAPAKKSGGWLLKLAAPLAAAALWAGAHFSAPARVPGFWVKSAPYLTGAGILLAAHALNGLARRGVDLLAARLHWKPGTVMAARLGASILVYVAGGALALHSIGVTTGALLTTFGIGGVAMTMAAKDFIGNFLEGVKMLANHPFAIGDRVKIGDREYTVQDMDLRYLSLARQDGGVTMMTYSQLSEKMVTIFSEYARRALPGASGLRSLWTGMGRLVKDLPRPSLLKASLWTALGVGLAVALPFLPALAPFHALAAASAWLPYLKGAMTMLAAHFIEKGAVSFIRRAAEDQGWRPQQAVILKLGVQLGVYLVGGTVALHFFGMTWAALLKSLGATSIAVGWASADIIGNIIQGFWILATHPFAIGDRLEVGAVSGTVADMNLSYVVLQHEDGSHTLVPYAVLKASPFTVLAKASDQGASR